MLFHVRLLTDGDLTHALAWAQGPGVPPHRHAITQASNPAEALTRLRTDHGVLDPIVTHGWAGEEEEDVMRVALIVH